MELRVSVKIMSRVWEGSSCKGTELLTLLALADFANDDSELCYPSLPVIARKVRLSVRQVCHILDRLERAGELRRERSQGGKKHLTRYFILTPNREASNTEASNTVIRNSEVQGHQTVKSHAERVKEKESNKEKEKNHQGTVSRRSKAAPPNPAVNDFKSFWETEYQKRFSTAYLFDHKIEGKIIHDMLVKFDLGTLKTKAEQFFESDDEWIQTKGGFTIRLFRTRINNLNSVKAHRRHDFDEGVYPPA